MTAEASADLPQTTTFNLLFVCTGNTCRSPMAEAIARRELDARGWRNVHVRSAGVAARSGGRASREAVTVANRYGLDLGTHRSSTLAPELVEWADLVLAMGPSHLHAIDVMGAGEKASTLGDFAAGGEGLGDAVPDPFGADEDAYETTFRELRRLVAAALDRLAPILHP